MGRVVPDFLVTGLSSTPNCKCDLQVRATCMLMRKWGNMGLLICTMYRRIIEARVGARGSFTITQEPSAGLISFRVATGQRHMSRSVLSCLRIIPKYSAND